ncbi:hypothetical protein AAG570_013745 [Ranatra chinensis]|uniref:Uncharacterized protein n=1 Tax=Ranatra chinensis TaxID=642074 RepID=A0ABD0YDD3_9HEMI
MSLGRREVIIDKENGGVYLRAANDKNGTVPQPKVRNNTNSVNNLPFSANSVTNRTIGNRGVAVNRPLNTITNCRTTFPRGDILVEAMILAGLQDLVTPPSNEETKATAHRPIVKQEIEDRRRSERQQELNRDEATQVTVAVWLLVENMT